MLITPEIQQFAEKKLIGYHLNMSLANDRTFELWSSFMPRRKEIPNPLSTDLYSIQVYDNTMDFNTFNIHTNLEKWAAIEVPDFNTIPNGMDTIIIPQGLYATFTYKGLPQDFEPIIRYFYENWLPTSGYAPDHRPHFEILGTKYKNNHPDSEEEIWIPVRRK